MNDSSRTVVLGLGNELLRDEGIGVHIVRSLQELPSLDGVEVVDGGTLPDAPLTFAGVGKLIIVDAVLAGGEPAAIYRFRPEDIDKADRPLTSLHQMTLLENLWLLERLGEKPGEVVIIGVEPESLDWGLELTPRLQEKVSQIMELVLREAGIEDTVNLEKGGSQ